MSAHRTRRTSDRLLTPAVVIVALVIGGQVLAMVILAVTYLTARGVDPDPMLRLVTEAAGTVGVLVNLALTMGSRSGVAKVERTTGLDLPAKVDELAQKVDAALWVDAQHTRADVSAYQAARAMAADDATRPHPLVERGAAPAARRE